MSEQLYQQIFENNQAWAASKLSEQGDYFEQLAKGQAPPVLFIGCADSRVPANTIMGLAPGDVFVHRNVANLVVNTDLNIHSVIEYAVLNLKVDHIVVCGHYGCGGVKAAMGHQDLGVLNGWLREIRDVYRLHRHELDGIEDEEQRYRRLIQLNVHEQCLNVLKTTAVQKALEQRGGPRVHGWVFDLATGLINDQQFNDSAHYEVLKPVYQNA